MSPVNDMLPNQIFAASFNIELRALQTFQDQLHERSLEEAIECLYGCGGKIVCTGMGKCGYIAQKMVATFVSTGTQAVYLHPAEAIHGDLGAAAPGDVVLALSYSGETAEICEVLPHLKRMELPIVALTGRLDSTVGRLASHCILTNVEKEADPLNMAPTASTTLMLAVGDALASVLMHKRGFSKQDYAARHPGGSLGQKLLCRVEELAHAGADLPTISEEALVRDAIFEMTSKRLGTVFAQDSQGKLAGILTDGDLRRLFQRNPQPLDLPLRDVMTRTPQMIRNDALAVEALRLMEDRLITILAVVDDARNLTGAIHIHDILRAGIS